MASEPHTGYRYPQRLKPCYRGVRFQRVVRYGIGPPADFLEDLAADIKSLEDAIDGRAQNAGARVAATVAIDEAIDRGMSAVRELDAIVHNVFRNDAAALAEWTSASHVERPTRRAPPQAVSGEQGAEGGRA